MDQRPRASLLKFPGTNCDRETARGLREAGFDAEIVPFSTVDEGTVEGSDLIVFSGGFSYGDYVKAGRLARLEVESKLNHLLEEFVESGGHLLGICNGFQILLELGLLPEASLVQNESRRFVCRWVPLRLEAGNDRYFEGVPGEFELPVAHMEGRLVTRNRASEYLSRGLVPLRYEDNPNGSELRIAGLQDETGRVLGMMPHPERFLKPRHHYSSDWNERSNRGWGSFIFRSIHRTLASEGGVTRPESEPEVRRT